MTSWVYLLQDAGPFAYAVLLAAALALPATLALWGASLFKLRVPVALWWAMPVLAALLGLVGTYLGLGQVADAVPHASPDVTGLLAAAGLAVSYYDAIFGYALAAVLCLLTAVALGSAQLMRPGDDARWTPSGLGGAVVLLLLALGLGGASFTPAMRATGLSGALGAGWALCGALALGMASARKGSSDTDNQRGAALRGAVAGSLAVSAVAALLAGRYLGYASLFDAVAHGAPEQRTWLMAAGLSIVQGETMFWGAAALGALVAGAASLGPVLKHLQTTRTALSGVAALLLLAPVGLLQLTVNASEGPTVALTPLSATPATLAAEVPRLPTAYGGGFWRGGCVLTQAGKAWRARSFGAPLPGCPEDGPPTLPFDKELPVTVALAASSSARELAETQWYSAHGDLDLLTYGPVPGAFSELEHRLTTLAWTTVAPDLSDPTWVGVLEVDGGVRVLHLSEPVADAPSTVMGLAAWARDQHVEGLAIAPPAKWTVQDLVDLCVDAPYRCELIALAQLRAVPGAGVEVKRD